MIHSFAEELMVLLSDDEVIDLVAVPERTLRYALAGALLLDLALAGRIDTDRDTLFIADDTPLDDDLLDPVLAEIVQESEHQNTEYWARHLAQNSQDLHDQVMERLVDRGIMEKDDGGVFALARRVTRSYRLPTSSEEEGRMSETRTYARILRVLYSDEIPETREIAIISLAHACDLFRLVLDSTEYKEVEKRVELISRLELSVHAVLDAVRTLTVSEAMEEERAVRSQGGEWPMASGRLPLVGHGLSMARDPVSYMVSQYHAHGPIFELHLRSNRYVVLAGREANLFMAKSGRAHLRTRKFWQGYRNAIGSDNFLLALDGAEHRLLRRALRYGFSRNNFLARAPEAVEIFRRELAKLPFNRSLPVFPVIQRILAEQIAVLAANTSFGDYYEDVEFFHRTAFSVYFARLYPRIIMKMPHVRRARRRVEQKIVEMIRDHEANERAQPDLVDDVLELHRSRPDFISEMDLLITLLFPFEAGLDTVCPQTAFGLYHFLSNSEYYEAARAEADAMFESGGPTAENLDKLDVIRRVLMEAIRVHPMAPVSGPRQVVNAVNFAGHYIPYGTMVMLAWPVTFFLPELFPEPYSFDIDRYLPERREHTQHGAYVPFGLGHHSCMGQGFATLQMALAVACLLHFTDPVLTQPGYRLRKNHLPSSTPHKSFQFTLRPREHL